MILEPHTIQGDQVRDIQNLTEIVEKVNQEIGYLGSIHLRRGHKLWELNLDTMILSEAKVNRKAAVSFGDIKPPSMFDFDNLKNSIREPKGKAVLTSSLTVNPHSLYVAALSPSSAKKKFDTMIIKIFEHAKRSERTGAL